MITDELQSIAMAEQDNETTPLKQWRVQFESSQLQVQDVVQFLETSSAAHYTVVTKEPTMCAYDDEGAKCAILDVVEEFILGDNPQTVHERISIEGSVSSVCGHVFKINEPTYSCRECGVDGTCVLCVTCFKLSPHRTHRYKMGTSGGGGCCDCGDTEAWKRDPACTRHAQAASDRADSSAVINEQMRLRCSLVFEAALLYCTQSLRIETDAALKATTGTTPAAIALSNVLAAGAAFGGAGVVAPPVISPPPANVGDEEQIYCTVMYNDETHTFEQVIQTLTRIVGCNQKDAVDFVSSIDREGRAVVKCAPFEVCRKLKEEIESTAPRAIPLAARSAQLKVAVLHMNAVACQQLALQLLVWMQEFCARHAIFRALFARAIAQGGHLTHIMLYDWKLWKTARLSWHHLLITALLMEYDNKKQLALQFTKLYPSLMSDYIRDDHDHSFSIVSLSVQLFTVPSIAQHLIAHESAFYKLMHTFYSESIEKFVSKKVLIFARQLANQNVFKRAGFILFDLKYILSFRPDVWTDELRKNFLHGVQVLMRLLKEMQGMDSVFRQTGQHMEYEPEWESAFNLHIKLAHVITLVLEWCGTDRIVLVKVYRMVMANLAESEFILAQTRPEVKELADHSTSTLMYDVASKNVSIHLPLSRFFAGLYLHLERFGYTFFNIMGNTTKPTPEELIEPVLCTMTMIAQVHAGLWRRNGYSLLNQLYFYRNVKCRGEMLDRDVVMLQIGASLIEANEFLIHVISKVNLLAWAGPDFEQLALEDDGVRQTINMLDEMLEMMIVIVGERHMPGVGRVTERQRLQKELIQQLAIKPHSHSELNKTLTDAQQQDAEDIIGEVAEFTKPTGTDKKGVYLLRRSFYDEYNMFYYHYTKEEKSRSEEMHRERRKEAHLLDCCPPPKLPRLSANFETLVCLLNCDVMMLVIRTVLQRSLDLHARHFTESHLQKVLHLVGFALHEEESGAYPYFKFVQRAEREGVLAQLEELVGSQRVEVHRDLLVWSVRRFKEVLQLVEAATSAAQPKQPDVAVAAEAGEAANDGSAPLDASTSSSSGSSVSTVMARKCALGGDEEQSPASQAAATDEDSPMRCAAASGAQGPTTTAENTSPEVTSPPNSPSETERLEKEARQRLAAQRRAKIMEQMRSAQTSFMTTNAELFKSAAETTATAAAAVELPAAAAAAASGQQQQRMDWQTAGAADAAGATGPTIAACLGRAKPVQPELAPSVQHDEYTCILCSEDAVVDATSPCMVYSAFIQTSKVMAHANNEAVSPHVNSCGHVMHAVCWSKYFENEALKETRRPNRNRAPGTFHIDKKEFLCPLCRCLSNVVLPVPPSLTYYGVDRRTEEEKRLAAAARQQQLPAEQESENMDIAVSSPSSTTTSTTTTPTPPSPTIATATATEPVSFATWLRIMEHYARTLAAIDNFAELTESSSFPGDSAASTSAAAAAAAATADPEHRQLPNLRTLCEPYAPYDAFALCCPATVTRQSLSTELAQYIQEFILTARKVSPFPYAAETAEPYLVGWLACAYTVEALEMQLRASRKPLRGHMSIRQTSGLRGLLRTGGLLSVCAKATVAAKLTVHVRGLLSTVFGIEAAPDAAGALPAPAACASIVSYDIFKMLASMVFLVPATLYLSDTECAVPNGQLMEFYLLKMMHVANVVKIMLLHDEAADASRAAVADCSRMEIDAQAETEPAAEPAAEAEAAALDPLVAFYTKYNFHQKPGATATMTRSRLDAIIAAGSSTFLRCSVLLFHAITDCEMPAELERLEPAAGSADAHHYETMCSYLGCSPDASVYFRADAAADSDAAATLRFATQLAENRNNAQFRAGRTPSAPASPAAAESPVVVAAAAAIVPCVTPISSFVELPEDYSDLINSVSQFTCPNNLRDDTRNPTMCLICGAILCSMTYCCQVEVNGATVGACTAHTMSCGAGVGAFLRIRDCEVLLLGFNKGCFVSAPYLDEYGETDQGLRRGNALRLCPERLRKLHMMWLTHCMHEDIARLAEASNSMIQTQWQNM